MKYSKELEDKIYNFIKKENPTFDELCKHIGIDYDDLKDMLYKSSKKYKKNLLKKINKARSEFLRDKKIKIENELIKKASGFYSKDIVKEIKTDKDGNESSSIKYNYKYHSPSEKAIIVFFEILRRRKESILSKKKLKDNGLNINIGFNE